jgi:hypothetical protein
MRLSGLKKSSKGEIKMYKNQKYKKAEFFLKIRVFVKSKFLKEKDIFDKENPQYLSFCEAKKFIRTLKFKNTADTLKYLNHTKLKLIPKNPREFYLKKGWWGYGDFIGIFPKDNCFS